MPVEKPVSVVDVLNDVHDKANNLLNVSTNVTAIAKIGSDLLRNYQFQNETVSGSISYFGYENSSAEWLYKKLDETTDTIMRYANVSNNPTITSYTLALADPTTLVYDLLENLTFNVTAGESTNTVVTESGNRSNFELEVGKGNITGYDWEFLTGDNTMVGTSETILRDAGGTGDYPFPDVASRWYIVSTDTNDTNSSGIGARSLFCIFIEDQPTFTEVFEFVNLNGTTPVQIATTAYRVNSMAVFTAGSSYENIGQIRLTTLSGAGALLGTITAREGQMRQPIRTVPGIETWFPLNYHPTSGKGDDIDVRAIAFTNLPIPNRRRLMFSKTFLFQSAPAFKNDTRIQFPGGFDVQVLAVKDAGAASGRVAIILEFLTAVTSNF